MTVEQIRISLRQNPIITERTVIEPMDEESFADYLNYAMTAVSLLEDDNLAEKIKSDCRRDTFANNALVLSVRLSDTEEIIGFFQLKKIDSAPEIGIDILKEQQAKGFGYEICRSCIDYIFSNTDIEVLYYNCFKTNAVSLNLSKKLGAEFVKEIGLFDAVQKTDASEELQKRAEDFNVLIHVIKRNAWGHDI